MYLLVEKNEGPALVPMIGIDLGTTNSLVCVFEDGHTRVLANGNGNDMTPSVVAVDANDRLVIGDAAKAMLVSDPTRCAAVFKRNLGTAAKFRLGSKHNLQAMDMSALILRDLQQTAQAALGVPVTDVVISVPAYFNQKQRKEVVAAAELVGLSVVRLINEPTAAALAYGLQDREGESTFIVLDLGGGTFDVSVLEMFDGVMEVRATSGDVFLGGEDFTDTLAGWIAKRNGDEWSDLEPTLTSIYRNVAEETKIALSQAKSVVFDRRVQNKNIQFTITQDLFAQINDQNIKRLRAPIERALYDAQINPEDIDRVILVGGATRMPAIKSFVAKQLLKFPETKLNPEHVVAQGTAVQAALAAKDAALDDIVMTDVSAFSLGMETSRTVSSKRRVSGLFRPIIERNSVVPISRVETMYAAQKEQDWVTIRVFQGEAPMVEDNLALGELKVKVPYNRNENEPIEVRFSYDASGLLEVEATRDQKTSRLVVTDLAGEMTDAELARRMAELQGIKTHPQEEGPNIEVLAKLKKCYAMSLADDREMIMDWIIEFEQVLDRQDPREIVPARQEMMQRINGYEDYYVTR